jgi:hypothetical protein
MTDLSMAPQDPAGTQAQPTDLIPALRNGSVVALTVEQLMLGVSAALTQPADSVLGRLPNAGSGEVVPISPVTGLALQSGGLAATAEDHLGLNLLASLDLNMELVINSAGAPSRISFSTVLAFLQGLLGNSAAAGDDTAFLLLGIL